MRLYNCIVNLVDQAGHMTTQVVKSGVTAAEVICLRDIHGNQNVVNIQPVGQDKRSHLAERARLTELYPVRDGAPSRIDRLFGGNHQPLPVELPDVSIKDAILADGAKE